MQKKITHLLNSCFNPILNTLNPILQKHYKIFLFTIIPIVFLLNTLTVHHYQSPFFQSSVDPEYFHLFNGISIGKGNLDVEYIAHPATPLQYLIGISARIIHVFQPGEDFIQDFIDNPELYIHSANLFMNIITALILMISGIVTMKYSGSFILGLIIQMAPFGNSSLLMISGRLLPESIMVIPLLLLSLLTIRYIFSGSESESNRTYLVLFGIITGFGIACKLSFIPVVMLPLILLKTSIKQKIVYLLYTAGFFLIFAYPVIFNFSVWKEWITGIFTHSGMHGGGEMNFIDLSAVPGNFKYLFGYDKLFFYIMVISLLLSILVSFRLFKDTTNSNSKIIRAIVAVNITIIFCIVFILKHFVFHYFMPFYIFKYLLILLITLLILHIRPQMSSKNYRVAIISTVFILTLLVTYSQALNVSESLKNSAKMQADRQWSSDKIIPIVDKEKIIIITGPYYGTPFIEYALNEGFMMSYNRKAAFKPYLMDKYPNSYFYLNWSDKFYHWDNFVDFRQIFEKVNDSFYVYLGREKQNNITEIENRMFQIVSDTLIIKTVLYEEIDTGETLIEYTLSANKPIIRESKISDN